MFDGAAFGREIVAEVRGFMDRTLAPVVERLDALERRISDFPAPKDGEPGKDADPEEVAAIVAERLSKEIESLRSVIDEIGRAHV